jgi:hypothetical protein
MKSAIAPPRSICHSDWFVILQQKPETIADFKKHDRFEMDDYTDALLICGRCGHRFR